MSGRVCLAALIIWCGAAVADVTPLQGARVVQQTGDAVVVEFEFADDVRMTAQQTKPNGIEIRLRASTMSSQWEQKEESFSGDLGAVEKVTFEGSGVGGYLLAVQLDQTMTVEVLPQGDARRIEIRMTKSAGARVAAEPATNAVVSALQFSNGAAPSTASGSLSGATAKVPVQQIDTLSAEVTAAPATDLPRAPRAPPVQVVGQGQGVPATARTLPAATAPVAAFASAAAAMVTSSAPEDPSMYTRALAEGRQAAMNQDYPRAIALYTKATESSDVAERQEALEMLAMARERNHQDAQAKVIYDQFLAQYPDSEAAPRIRQRLLGLITRDLPVQQKLKPPTRDGVAWTAVGNVSQFYQRNELSVNGDKSVVGVDGLFTNADVIVGRRTSSLDLEMRVSTNGLYDFGSDGDSTYQMSTAYFEAQQIDWGVDVRVGRQSQQSNGVLGRYDGAQVTYKVLPWLQLGSLAGYAVDYGANGFTTDRPLYGVNARISVADGMWEFAPFYIEQQANGLLDRRAVGMETRFFRNNFSVFSLLDYDTYHQALNTSYLMVNYRFENGLSSYLNFDHRRSPYFTTENALIGQGVNNLGDLENTYTNQQIQQLADDRTSTLTVGTFGVDKEITQRFQLGGDLSYSDYSDTQASGDVPATPSRRDYYYTLRFRLDEIFGAQTYSAIYLRYTDSPDSRASSVYWNNRFTFRNVWQLYPRIRVGYQDFSSVGQTQWTISPSLRLDYRPTRSMYFEFEGGYDSTRRDAQVSTQSMDLVGYYVRLGWRTLF